VEGSDASGYGQQSDKAQEVTPQSEGFNSPHVNPKYDQTAQKPTEEDEYGLGSEPEEEEEYTHDEEGMPQNDIAYKSVEIEEGIMKSELFGLRSVVWEIEEQVSNMYDFGLVQLDCTKYKERLLKHCSKLIDQLEDYVRTDFLTRMKSIVLERNQVSGKLEEDSNSIDDVIMLLDYIEELKNDDSKIEDIRVMIEALNVRMEYTERLEIIFENGEYLEFLHLRNWPKTFRDYIERRKLELLSKKDNLFEAMSEDIAKIFNQIKMFQEQLGDVLKRGLNKADLEKEAEQWAKVAKKAKQRQRGGPTSA
jgi:hypothetical protein